VPWKSTTSPGYITFSGLSPHAKIRIFTTNGQLVKELEAGETDIQKPWYVDNIRGERVASGVYHYVIINGDKTQKRTGKLVVIQ
jgi:hypothetical protein